MIEDQKNRADTWRLGGLTVLAVFMCNTAYASGYIGPFERRQIMSNFPACVAHLNSLAAEHRNLLLSRQFAQDGSFREVNVEDLSKGVTITGSKRAHYKAKIWYSAGRLDQDKLSYEISHSWDESNYECKGKFMVIILSQGYTLSTFEAAASINPPR